MSKNKRVKHNKVWGESFNILGELADCLPKTRPRIEQIHSLRDHIKYCERRISNLRERQGRLKFPDANIEATLKKTMECLANAQFRLVTMELQVGKDGRINEFNRQESSRKKTHSPVRPAKTIYFDPIVDKRIEEKKIKKQEEAAISKARLLLIGEPTDPNKLADA